ncbi:MAG TPA: hypothetical protein VG673_17940 [Actinomycetota bacterium]|nr:hypothetical protein [Actinomycetota bacterium]
MAVPAASMAATATMSQVMADPRGSAAATSARMPAYPVQATTLLAATATATAASGAPASSSANVPTRRTASAAAVARRRARPSRRTLSRAATGADSATPTSMAALHRPSPASPRLAVTCRLNTVQPSDSPKESTSAVAIRRRSRVMAAR